MQKDFFDNNLFSELYIESTASEQDIQSAITSLKSRVDQGMVFGNDEINRIKKLEALVDDKKFRLKSMIYKGGFGLETLDLQFQRLKKLFSKTNFVPQEWIDVLETIQVFLLDQEKRSFLLDACNITDKNDAEDLKLMDAIIDEMHQDFVNYHVEQAETKLKHAEKDVSIKHFKVIYDYPDIKASFKNDIVDSLMALYFANASEEIDKIKKLEEDVKSISSKFQAKAELGKLERDFKNMVLPVFSLINEIEFSVKEEYLHFFKDFFKEMVTIFSEYEVADKVAYFSAFLSAGDQKDIKKSTTKKIVLDDDMDSSVKEIVTQIKDLCASGKVKAARRLFLKEKNKANKTEDLQLFEQIELDPFFFIDHADCINLKDSKKSFYYEKTSISNEDGDYILIVWLKLSFPLIPFKAFAFNAGERCIGRVELPSKYKVVRLMIPLMILFFGLFVFSLFSSDDKGDNAEQARAVSELNQAEEQNLDKSTQLGMVIDLLVSKSIRNNDVYQETYSKLVSLFSDLFNQFQKEDRLKEFVDFFGAKALKLNKSERNQLAVVFKIQSFSFLEKNDYKNDYFLKWYLKMGNYALASEIIEKKIIFGSNKKNKRCLKEAIELSRLYRIKLSDNILKQLLKNDVISKKEALVLCHNYKSFGEDMWHEIALALWRKDMTLPYHEAMKIISNINKNLPGMRLDLLSVLLDSNKDKVFKWNEVKFNFQHKAIEKRVKIRVCNYYIMKGDFKKAIELSKFIPESPKNDALYFLRMPVFYLQKKYSRIIFFLEKYKLHHKLDNYYKAILGLSYVAKGEFGKGYEYIHPIVNNNYRNFIKIWEELNARKGVVRDFVNKQLKAKKGRFEAPARKFYLMQDPTAAEYAKDNFILNEIRNDFKVKQFEQKLADLWYVHDAIYSLVNVYIHQNESTKLRNAKDLLLALREQFFSYDTEIVLAKVFDKLDKKPEVIEILQRVEYKALLEKQPKPLIDLIETYDYLKMFSFKKKLIKKIFKKCKGESFLRDVCLILYQLETDDNKKLNWLNKIKEPTSDDQIRIILSKIDLAVKENDVKDIIAAFGDLERSVSFFSLIDDLNVLQRSGRALFLNYKFTGSLNALKYSLNNFQRIAMIEDTNVTYLNELCTVLWFLTLEHSFTKSKYLHLIMENNNMFLIDAIEKEILNGTVATCIDKINQSDHFKLFKKYFKKLFILSDSFVVLPPGMISLVLTEGLDFMEPGYLRDENIQQAQFLAFDEFWKFASFNLYSYVSEKLETQMNLDKKSLKAIAEEDITRYSRATIAWVSSVLRFWMFSKETLKMGFDNLQNKLKFFNAQSSSVQLKIANLNLGMFKLAFWYNPDKNWFINISPAFIIFKAIYENRQQLKLKEINDLKSIANPLLETYLPFYNENLLAILFIGSNNDISLSFNDRQKRVINLYEKSATKRFKKLFIEALIQDKS